MKGTGDSKGLPTSHFGAPFGGSTDFCYPTDIGPLEGSQQS